MLITIEAAIGLSGCSMARRRRRRYNECSRASRIVLSLVRKRKKHPTPVPTATECPKLLQINPEYRHRCRHGFLKREVRFSPSERS